MFTWWNRKWPGRHLGYLYIKVCMSTAATRQPNDRMLCGRGWSRPVELRCPFTWFQDKILRWNESLDPDLKSSANLIRNGFIFVSESSKHFYTSERVHFGLKLDPVSYKHTLIFPWLISINSQYLTANSNTLWRFIFELLHSICKWLKC